LASSYTSTRSSGKPRSRHRSSGTAARRRTPSSNNGTVALGFLREAKAATAGLGLQGARGGISIGAHGHLGVRAKGRRGARAVGSDSAGSPARARARGRARQVGATWRRDREGRGVASGWAGIEVNGPAALVSWAAGEERKKKKRGRRVVGPGWIGLEEIEMFYLFGRRF